MKQDREKRALSTADRLRGEFGGITLPGGALDFLSRFDQKKIIECMSCFRGDAVERRLGSSINGIGLFSVENIGKGVLIAIKQGYVVDEATIKKNLNGIHGSHQQIGPDEFLTGFMPDEVETNLVGYNHSCDPNARIVLLQGVPLAFVVATKDIPKDTEITVDYSVSMTSDTHRIDPCNCGSSNCRHTIEPSTDWRDEGFQKANAAYFPWYIKDMIKESRS